MAKDESRERAVAAAPHRRRRKNHTAHRDWWSTAICGRSRAAKAATWVTAPVSRRPRNSGGLRENTYHVYGLRLDSAWPLPYSRDRSSQPRERLAAPRHHCGVPTRARTHQRSGWTFSLGHGVTARRIALFAMVRRVRIPHSTGWPRHHVPSAHRARRRCVPHAPRAIALIRLDQSGIRAAAFDDHRHRRRRGRADGRLRIWQVEPRRIVREGRLSPADRRPAGHGT